MARLRIGLLLPSLTLPAWVAEMLEKVLSLTEVDLIHLVLAPCEKTSGLHPLHCALDQRVFRSQLNPFLEQPCPDPLNGLAKTLWEDPLKPPPLSLPALDLLLNLACRDYSEGLLKHATYGVWTLHDGAGRFVIGSPAGWQPLTQESFITPFAIEVARADKKKQYIAHCVMATKRNSLSRNQTNLLWKAAATIPLLLRQLASLGEAFLEERTRSIPILGEEATFDYPSHLQPTALETFQLASLQITRAIQQRWGNVFSHAQWLLLCKPRINTDLTWEGFQRIAPPKDRFWADPFVVEREGRAYLFIEELFYDTYRGTINCLTLDKNGKLIGNNVVLSRPYHLSYPFIFEYGGETYMLPETGGNNAIEIYRCTRFPDQWNLEKTLMNGTRTADNTLLEHDGRWWLFTTVVEKGNSSWDSLHIFYADNPLSDHWTPHPKNPVVTDVRRARMAGRIFEQDGFWIRPSQDSSRIYGYALNQNRITRLTTTDYAEALVDRLTPAPDGEFLGVHTFNFSEHWTVMDGLIRARR